MREEDLIAVFVPGRVVEVQGLPNTHLVYKLRAAIQRLLTYNSFITGDLSIAKRVEIYKYYFNRELVGYDVIAVVNATSKSINGECR